MNKRIKDNWDRHFERVIRETKRIVEAKDKQPVPNPNPEYYNCQCKACGAWLHRPESQMRPGRNYFCSNDELIAWKHENGIYRKEQMKVGRRRGCQLGPALKVGGVVYG